MNEPTSRIPEPPTEPDPVRSDNDWEPQKNGDSIVGVVAAREGFRSEKFGRDFEVLTIRTADGVEKRVSCARAHLKQLVAEHDPQVGDAVAIAYFGQRPDGFGFQYAMRVERANGDDSIPF